MSEEIQKNPDEILEEIRRQEESQDLGKLKIFFGMSAGVGKTYSMLEEAQRCMREGMNVVVGTINTHGRKETEKLLEGLKCIPEKWVSYKDTVFEEFDLDTILQLKPQLVLVDELAHTNVPGSRHPKRWQDVEELLEAGIDVFTTLNVQHIESRKEIVESHTGIQIRETVPDKFIEKATNIEIVDISPSELLQRLREGKVYLGNQSLLAAQNFFKEENLTILRELALRYTAEKVEHDFHGMLKGWVSSEKLMVGISQSPSSESIIRSAKRLASELDAPWVAVYVDTGKKLNDEEQARLNKHCNLARELGAEVITTHDIDIATALQRVAKQKNISRIVIGRSPKKKFDFLKFFKSGFIERLEEENKDIDIVVLRQDKSTSNYVPSMMQDILNLRKEYFIGAGVITLISLIGYLNAPFIGYKVMAFLYFITILLLGLFLNQGPVLLAASLCPLAWYFLFSSQNFMIYNYQDAILFIIYFCVVTFIGAFTSHLRKQYQLLRDREEKIERLYEMDKDISKSSNLRALRANVSTHLESIFPGKFEILLKNTENELILDGHIALLKEEKERAAALWAYQRGKIAGWSTDTLPSAQGIYFPIRYSKTPVGVLLYKPQRQRQLSLDEINFIQAVIQQLGIYLERYIFEERLNKQEYIRQIERLHSSILRSLNRSFYTPLNEISQITHQLQEKNLDPNIRSLIDETSNFISKIKFTVDNIIAISELESGFIHFDKKEHSLMCIIDASLQEIDSSIQGYSIIYMPTSDLSFYGDFKMLKLLINNLILNAVKHSPPEKPIIIDAKIIKKRIKITISDQGPGIPKELIPHIFDKFYQISNRNIPSKSNGLGLGLSIVKTIADIHYGKIEVKNREEGGTMFSLLLPLD